MDQLIEEQQGMAIMIFLPHMGENWFPRPETELLGSESTGYVVLLRRRQCTQDENAGADEGERLYCSFGRRRDDLRKSRGQYEPPDFKREYEMEYIRELMEKRRPRYEAVAIACVTSGRQGRDTSVRRS